MGLQVNLVNTIEVNKNEIKLEICVERQKTTCKNVGKIQKPGKRIPKTSDPTVKSVKITPTDKSGRMPGYWQIKMTEYVDEVVFSPGGAYVHKYIYSKKNQELLIQLQGGTRNWELTIIKPEGSSSEDSKEDWREQTSNVTIGSDWV
ncbi:MAG: hypothetical protein PVH61_02470 [Candidatus Aminicenantes bacterium]|jgi:hypothetical protein